MRRVTTSSVRPVVAVPYTTIASGLTATNYTDTVTAVGLNYYYVVSAIIGGVATANSAEAMANVPLPNPWVSLDVGAVGLAGSANYSSGVFTVAGAGAGISEHGRRLPLCLCARHRKLHHDCPRRLCAKH